MKPKHKGIFITATDTGVGKTYVGAAIAKELRRQGVNVGVMKPAETGCRRVKGQLRASDATLLMKAAGVRDSLDMVNPYCFSNPLAPSVAAQIEGKPISRERLKRAYQSLSLKHDFMLVEGAGGIMVPLTDRYSYLDLATDFDLPIIIVSRPGLGTINHTLLTIAALKQRKLTIAGIVINYTNDRNAGLAEKTSPRVLEKISGIKILSIIRHHSDDIENIIANI